LEAAIREKVGPEGLHKFEKSEGGDKFYLRFAKAVPADEIAAVFKAQGINYAGINTFGRTEDNQLEVVLVGITQEVTRALDGKLGQGAVKSIPASDSVGAKAGEELRNNGIKSLLLAILAIMIYI